MVTDDALSPISLTDDQLSAVMQAAEPLPPQDRSRFLRRVASLLRGRELGDGAVSRAARQAQAELFSAPRFNGNRAPRFGRRASAHRA
jgi:hypothetical protein